LPIEAFGKKPRKHFFRYAGSLRHLLDWPNIFLMAIKSLSWFFDIGRVNQRRSD
jgi:hypothetical protein